MRVLLAVLAPPGAEDKATLDTDKLKEDVPRGLQKVELDLDDALFLDVDEEEPKPEPAAEPAPPPPPQPAPEPAKRPLWKRPLVLALVGGLLLFLLGGVAAYFLLPRQATAPPPPPPKEEKPKKPAKPEKPITLHTIPFEPFFVEYDQDGTKRFLVCRFSVSGIPDALEWEIRRKKIILRDAVYYYLHNKGLAFLNDPKNADKLKEDLLAVMNQYLGNGQIETLLLDEYVIR